jgi:type VI secretion system secreted protein VgrG
MPTTQDKRLIAVTTPLGKDKLLLNFVAGRDGISQLFRYRLDLLSEDAKIDPAKLIGQSVTISIELGKTASGKQRYFNGLVKSFTASGRTLRSTSSERSYWQYQAEVVPWLWMLTQTADSRIFQDKTVPEVIEQIFKEYGFKDFRKALTGQYTKWDYNVQYRETDFNFVARLMEQEGIFYFFEHEKDKHTLVLADALAACKPSPDQGKARFEPEGGTGDLAEDTIASWQTTQSFEPGKYTYRDYHFEKPDSTFEVNRPSANKVGGNDKYEIYDYPGEYAQRFNQPSQRLGDIKPEGEKLVKVRMEEEESPIKVATVVSNVRAIASGNQLELTKHPSQDGKYVLTTMEFTVAQSPDYLTDAGVGQAYQNAFTAVPEKTPFHPARTTPKPVIQSLQNAVVVGLQGKEIDVDKFGRIKVQFPWDREGKKNEKSSCWLRVAQPWAGKRWGAFFWPRIGQEVLVAFMEGDPDAPIVVGSVYNAEQMPPYIGDGLDPKHKHDPNLTGIKTNSTLGGKGYNELRFDDTKDKEQIFIHSERNLDTRVDHECIEWVGSHRHLIVGPNGKDNKKGDQRELVHQDKHLNVKRHQAEKIEGNLQMTIGHGEGSGGNLDLLVAGNKTETIEKEFDLHVKTDRKTKVDAGDSLNVGGEANTKVATTYALEAGTMVHIKSGATLVLEAGAQLSLKVGGNFIDISPAGVSIVGTMVMINSGGSAGSGPGANPQAPQDAQEAKPTKPTEADKSVSGNKSAPG